MGDFPALDSPNVFCVLVPAAIASDASQVAQHLDRAANAGIGRRGEWAFLSDRDPRYPEMFRVTVAGLRAHRHVFTVISQARGTLFVKVGGGLRVCRLVVAALVGASPC